MRLPQVSGKEVIKALCKFGFVVVRQKGSHVILEKQGSDKVIKITVPIHVNLKKGTLSSIIKEAELTLEEFLDLL